MIFTLFLTLKKNTKLENNDIQGEPREVATGTCGSNSNCGRQKGDGRDQSQGAAPAAGGVRDRHAREDGVRLDEHPVALFGQSCSGW